MPDTPWKTNWNREEQLVATAVVQVKVMGVMERGRSGCFGSMFWRLRQAHLRLDVGAEGISAVRTEGRDLVQGEWACEV